MAVGQNALVGFPSYLAVARETTYGTYVTATAGIEFISSSLRTMKEAKVIEEITTHRVYADTISLGKKIEGDIEIHYDPRSTAAAYLLQNAMGGAAITSATATGETAGGSAFTHTFTLGNFDATHGSLSINTRKGDSASAKIFEFTGLRVNEFTLNSEIDEAVKATFSLIGKDSTISTNDVSTAIGNLNQWPLSFVSGRVSVESSFGSLTSTSFWHVQTVELTIANNLKADADSRRIGSDLLQVLPPGVAAITLNMTMRFDTTTAYTAMINNSQLACELEFLGDTLSGSAIRRGIKIQMPKIFITEASDPEIGGPDEILKTEVSALVLRDSSTSTGYAIRALVTNDTSSY